MTISDITKELELENKFTEDWGISNSSSSRVKEFILYHNRHHHLFDSGIKANFIELIISSMNEAILENKTDKDLYGAFEEFINFYLEEKDNILIYLSIIYWTGMPNKQEFPVSLLVDKLVPKDM